MKSLNEDLKTGKFKRVYLLHGEENYLKKQYRDRLLKAMLPEGDTMNYTYYEGKGIDVREVIDLAETLPFFAGRRYLVLENSGFFKAGGSDLAEYLKEVPDTTCFLFVEGEVDKRSKLYKAVKLKGYIAELSCQDEVTLKKWILGLVKREGKQISEGTLKIILEKAGTDMGNLLRELEKLFCYTLEKDAITEEDVNAVCITQISNHIFDMVNAVADKRQKQALDLYYELLALKEPPMKILFLMIRQYRVLFQVKDLLKKGYGRKEIATKAGLHPFVAGKYMEQTKNFRRRELRAIIEDGADLDMQIKTGHIADVLAVEVFIIKYATLIQ